MTNYFHYLFISLLLGLMLSSGVLNTIVVEKQLMETVQQPNEENESSFDFNFTEDEAHMPVDLESLATLMLRRNGEVFYYRYLFSEYFPSTELNPPETTV